MNSGWREPAPWSRPTSCWRTSCPDSTPNSVCLVNRPRPPIAPWTPPCIWNGSSASSTCAEWPGTTPSSTNYAPCNYFQPKTGPAMPVSRWRCWKGATDSSWSNTEEMIPHQEAPPKAGALRAAQGALAPTPGLAQVVRNLSQHGLTRKQLQHLAALGTPADQPADQPMDDENRPTPCTPPPTEATPWRQALWKAVRHAKLQGVPLRGIARQLGISRNTVRKYVDLPAPPINRTPRRSTQSLSNYLKTVVGADGGTRSERTPTG